MNGYELVNESIKYSSEQIKEIVIQVISEQLGIKESKIKLTSKLQNDLHMDSLDSVEIIMALEEHFDVEISEELVDDYTKKVGGKLTVQNLIEIVTLVLTNSNRNKTEVAKHILKKISK
jgi:acyl carrier protein